MKKGNKNYVWEGETYFSIYSPDMSNVLEECVSIYELCDPVEREDLFELGEDEPAFIKFLDDTVPDESKASFFDMNSNDIYHLYSLGNDDLVVTAIDDTITKVSRASFEEVKATYLELGATQIAARNTWIERR